MGGRRGVDRQSVARKLKGVAIFVDLSGMRQRWNGLSPSFVSLWLMWR